MTTIKVAPVAKLNPRHKINLLKKGKLFHFNGSTCKLLLDIDIQKLCQDLDVVKAFSLLHLQETESDDVLYLLYQPELVQKYFRTEIYIQAFKRIVETFFLIRQNNSCDVGNVKVENEHVEKDLSVERLYSELRQAHFTYDKFVTKTADIEHPYLQVKLTQYQKDAVQWMLQREKFDDYFPSEFVKIERRWPVEGDNHHFYYNEKTLGLQTVKQKEYELPTGGILADEMGLGKTIEMLALILFNQRNLKSMKKYDHDEDTAANAKRSKLDFSDNLLEVKVKCMCGQAEHKNLIRCTKCFHSQHRRCVLKHWTGQTPIEEYICPDCWRNEPLTKSGATFIVSPKTIKMQWFNEIKKHIENGRLKVFIYEGFKKTGWISPVDMATYDIVLTEYSVIGAEIHFSGDYTRYNIRRRTPRLSPASPLTLIHWWRVCLDEAQMVESVYNNSAQMVQQMHTCHRWAVTGTPIQKSVNDLYGLVYFLNCEPYSQAPKWRELMHEFTKKGNIYPLISVLRKIMWRTCKTEEILAQIRVPPQTKITHYITQSDLERLFYNHVRTKYRTEFEKAAGRVDKTMTMSTMDQQSLKWVMDPLRQLRYACTVPQITELDKSYQLVDKFLHTSELLKHLKRKNDENTKNELRTMLICLNNLADVYIIKGQNKLAVEKYLAMLEFSKNPDFENIGSLRQIHAIHNLLLINTEMDPATRAAYENEKGKLEWEHIRGRAKDTQTYKIYQEKVTDNVESLRINSEVSQYDWWQTIINLEEEKLNLEREKLRAEREELNLDSDEEEEEEEEELVSPLFKKIATEMEYNYSDVLFTCQTLNDISVMQSNWITDLNKGRDNLQKTIAKFSLFIENMRPASELSDDMKLHIENITANASQCHLSGTPQTIGGKGLCLWCQLKNGLDTYERLIFSKLNSNDVQGTRKPAHQEQIVKIFVHYSNRYNTEELDSDAKIHVKYLQGIKREYKALIRLSLHIDRALKAYDKVNGCKLRLTTVETDNILMKEENQLKESTVKFHKQLAVSNYLEHLDLNRNVADCPSCLQKPKEKYAVFGCGHHMCMNCFDVLVKKQTNELICSICQYQQDKNGVFYVNISQGQNSTVTNVSTKVDKIIQTIQELHREDESVKILIFSQWSQILTVIEDELRRIQIPFCSDVRKFQLIIAEFKDPKLNKTCLLLPLSYGSKGLNLTEATHVFLIEPLLNAGEERQAVGRVHRMGQTKPTFVHHFVARDTIEEKIYQLISNDEAGKWNVKECTVQNLLKFFD